MCSEDDESEELYSTDAMCSEGNWLFKLNCMLYSMNYTVLSILTMSDSGSKSKHPLKKPPKTPRTRDNPDPSLIQPSRHELIGHEQENRKKMV